MNAMRTAVCALLLSLSLVLIGPAAARAADVVLYEVTEAVRLGKSGSFKSSKATLSGVAAPGTTICPTWLATQLLVDGCTVTVTAVGRADDASGIGPVTGTFDVLMQDANNVDAPEIVIMRGNLSGTLDMSPAFVDKKPRGTVTGEFDASGIAGSVMTGQRARGRFDGVFRIPFRSGGKAAYLLDDGSVTLVQAGEFLLGSAMVRLELSFTAETMYTNNGKNTGKADDKKEKKEDKKEDAKKSSR
jgi:hypothetical protein